MKKIDHDESINYELSVVHLIRNTRRRTVSKWKHGYNRISVIVTVAKVRLLRVLGNAAVEFRLANVGRQSLGAESNRNAPRQLSAIWRILQTRFKKQNKKLKCTQLEIVKAQIFDRRPSAAWLREVSHSG